MFAHVADWLGRIHGRRIARTGGRWLPRLEHLESRSLLSITPVSFAAALSYRVGSDPLAIAAGDVNGDGRADVAVVNYHDNSVSVLMSTGSGLALAASYGTGAGPHGVAIADVSGDGKADIVVANGGGNSVSVLLNQGDGTFRAKVDYSVGTIPLSVAVGDIDGDGKADIAVANAYSISSTGTVSILPGKGGGTFDVHTEYAVGSYPDAVAIGDLNGDGMADLAAANFGGDSVSILLNSGVTESRFSFSRTDVAVDADPKSVVIAKLNGDGLADLATTSLHNTVSVLLNNGDGTSFARTEYAAGYYPYSVAAGDLNGDGFVDLATANDFDDTAAVLLNDGTGKFATKSAFSVDDEPNSMALGDVTGDGMLDIVTSGTWLNSVCLLRNITPMLGKVTDGVRALALPGKSAQGILSKLNAAMDATARRNVGAARNIISAAIREVEAMVKARKLDGGVAGMLIDDLRSVAGLL